MAKDRGRNPERGRSDERSLIAQLAARLIAEDGIEDYAAAKRKAARQAGVPDTRRLPTNDEIDAALHTHQLLYGGEAHIQRLQALRACALKVMLDLERFHPFLTGSVLSGNAGKYAHINLHLYTENEKGVELYLIERAIAYRAGQRKLWCGGEARTVPTFTVEDQGMEIDIVVLARDDLRLPVKTSPDGDPVERARTQTVKALIDEARDR